MYQQKDAQAVIYPSGIGVALQQYVGKSGLPGKGKPWPVHAA
ncbi:hypothetical protein [Fibrisoma montanum]|nr:hypothetical protein [Fibrisoma montanum]